MSDRMKRNLLATLGFIFCLLAVTLAVVRTWDDLQARQVVTE